MPGPDPISAGGEVVQVGEGGGGGLAESFGGVWKGWCAVIR